MFFWFRVFWRLEKLGYSNLVSWMNVIATPLCSVILNKWARWSHLARLRLPAVSRKQNFPESHMINLLLTKFSLFVLASFVFCEFMDLDFISVHKHAKKELGQYPAILTSHLVNNPYKIQIHSFKFMLMRSYIRLY